MIVPRRITVQNVRSIPDATIEPDPDGVTSLSGKIGSGKSSVLTALVWCLYGEVGGIPGLLTQADMRRRGSTEPVVVTVEFELAGRQFKAERTLRRSKKGKETAYAALFIDGQKQPSISPTKLTTRITTYTGLSGRAFCGAFFMAQGNLPALAEGTPSQVQALIEEQTGIAPLTRQIETARGEARDAQTRADALPGSLEAVDAAQSEVDQTQSTAEPLWPQLDAATAAHRQAITRADAAQAEADDLTARARAAQQAQVAAARAESARDAAKGRSVEIEAEIASLPTEPGTDEGELRAQRDSLRSAVETLTSAQDSVTRESKAVETARAAAEAARAAAGEAPGSDVSALAEKERAARDATVAARTEWTRLQKSITELRSLAGAGHRCPTCTQEVADPESLIGTLTRACTVVEAQGREAAAAASSAQAAHAAAVQEEQRHRDAVITARGAHQRRAEAEAALTAAQELVKDATDRLRSVAPATDGPLPVAARERLDTIDATLSAMQRAANLHAARAAARESWERADRALTEARKDAAAAPSMDELDRAATVLGQARDVVRDLERDKTELRSKVDVLTERVRAAEATRDRERGLLDKKAEASAAADTKRHAHQILVNLRKDLVGEYTETISDAATDLMAQVGGTTHVGVTIGEDFIPRVVLADGTTMPMRQLSGGEKMRAALCLRLGIAEQISGTGGQGAIFADEVTANHDDDTTTAVVEMMKGLGRPMILVAHAEKVQAIATRVYTFEKRNEHDGTTVTRADAAAALAGANQP